MKELESWVEYLSREQREVDRLIGEAQAVARRGKEVQESVQVLDEDIQNYDKAIAVLQSFGEARQQELQEKIERLVTHGLQTIFKEDIYFRIKTRPVGKLVAMDFEIATSLDGAEVATPVLEARGGGIAAVAGFLLRLVVLLLFGVEARPLLVLDEAFAQVSAEYVPSLAEFIRELVEKTPVQIVLITHTDGFLEVADTAYRFDLRGGKTVISQLH